MKLAGRTALVTGASSGIGEQFAHRLAERGTNLVLVARREQRLEELRGELVQRHPGLTVTVLAADLSDASSAGAIAARLEDDGVTVDLLINNAGVGSHDPFVEQDVTALAQQIQLNVGSLVDLTARFLPGMVTRDSGVVINLSSTAGFQPVPTMAVYAASKAFVLSFSEALWGETRSSSVRVFALCPGATETEFFQNTGKQFLTHGRQSPREVVDHALRAIDGSAPVVVPGLANRIGTLGSRVVPRRTLIRVSKLLVSASG